MKIRIDKTKQQENIKELTQKENGLIIIDECHESQIYDYFKAHPSVFISFISGFVVVIGFLFNCLMYSNECKYLEYWNLNKEIININNQRQIYELVLISFLFMSIMLIQLFIIGTVDRYCNDKKELWKARVLGRAINKRYNKYRKQFKAHQKKLKGGDRNDLLEQELIEEEIYLEELKNDLKGYKSTLKDIEKSLRRIRVPYHLCAILFSLLSIFSCVYIFFVITSIETKFTDIVFLTIMIFCIGWTEAYILSPIGFVPEVYLQFGKLDYTEQIKHHIESFDELLKVKKFPIQEIFNLRIKDFFEKNMLKKVMIIFSILIVVFIGVISGYYKKQIEQNKEFDIIEYESTDYAIMYRDDKYFYLEEVKIEENDIYIYVKNQLRISSEELYSVNREFDKVIKIPSKEDE